MKGKIASAAATAVLGLLVIAPATARAAGGAPEPGASPPNEVVVTTTGWYATDHADTISIFEPVGAGPFPAILFVHGGAWGRAQPNAYELDWARDLAAAQGWLVAVIGYPTKVKHEQIVEPNAVALAISGLARRPDVDRQAIAVWGESAGGQLALLSGYRDARRLHPQVSAIVSISGPREQAGRPGRAANWPAG